MMKKLIFAAIILSLFASLPFMVNDYFLHMVIMLMFYAYVSQAWNIMSGYSGQFSFGHGAFYGIGAYTSSLLFVKLGINPWIGTIAGAALAALVGLFIGFLSFRYHLKGAYFTLATLAFAEICRIIVENTAFMNKTMGVLVPLQPGFMNFQFNTGQGYYYVIGIFLVLITFLTWKISRSRLGFDLVAIRENEDAAQSLGVNTYKNKMIAIGLSSLLTAVGGSFYTQYILYIDPVKAFGNSTSVDILLPAVIGGTGSVWGPLVGALFTVPLSEITSAYFSRFPGLHLVIYGVLVIVIILFLPDGIVSIFDRVKKPFIKVWSVVKERIPFLKSVKQGRSE